jgi:hypothetical protein
MKKVSFIIIISNLLLLSCNTVRDSAGVNRKVIDEYTVVENPPLVIPPNFNLLPPEQIASKSVENTDSDLAKEILFGLENDQTQINEKNTLINEIIKETESESVENDIRTSINEDFAGEKSTINDETKFNNVDDLNIAIKETEEKGSNSKNKNKKKKKRFFFF